MLLRLVLLTSLTLLVFLVLSTSSLSVRADDGTGSVKIAGCASLNLYKAKATKVATIRAESEWIRLHKGIKVSGKESLTLSEYSKVDTIKQEISIKSEGYMKAFNVVKKEQLLIDAEPHICVYIEPK